MKVFTITLHLTILGALAYNYGQDMAAHPVALVFGAFSLLVLIRVLFK